LLPQATFESCGGFRAALLRLRRDVENHSTGHSRRGGVLGVGVLGEASGLIFFAGGAKTALAGVAAGTGIAGSAAGLPERRLQSLRSRQEESLFLPKA
jgi:hypothetical protein